MKNIFLILITLLITSCSDEKQWQTFKELRHCKIIAQTESYYTYMPMWIGKNMIMMPIYNAGYTTWLCDDKKSYNKDSD